VSPPVQQLDYHITVASGCLQEGFFGRVTAPCEAGTIQCGFTKGRYHPVPPNVSEPIPSSSASAFWEEQTVDTTTETDRLQSLL
jgi:hypothetical protein